MRHPAMEGGRGRGTRDAPIESFKLPKCKKTFRLSPVFPTRHRRIVPRHDGSQVTSRCVLPELFHHHQRVKIRALNPEGAWHHPVRLEAELPVKLPAA
jgi:hypothetical protein